MDYRFSEWIGTMIANRTTVSIGSGDNELQGRIAAFDSEQQVITYSNGADGTLYFIPMSSVRSIGIEETPEGASCFIDLFRK